MNISSGSTVQAFRRHVTAKRKMTELKGGMKKERFRKWRK
jgi:hypothetical protein